MPIPTESQPYIDPPPTAPQRAAAEALITRALPDNHINTLHPSLSPLSPAPAPPVQTPAIDTSRYEALDEIPLGSGDAETYRAALGVVGANTGYLGSRATNLGLLDEGGRNGWLVGNAVLEDMLGRAEGEVQAVRERVEGVNRARREGQESCRGEVVALEEGWRESVARIVETQVATAKLRMEVDRARSETKGKT